VVNRNFANRSGRPGNAPFSMCWSIKPVKLCVLVEIAGLTASTIRSMHINRRPPAQLNPVFRIEVSQYYDEL